MLKLLKKFKRQGKGELVQFNNLDAENRIIPDLDRKQLEFITSLKDYKENDVVLIHHHHGYPGINEIRKELHEARKAIAKQGGEMVVITIVREIIAYQTSRVNFSRKKGRDLSFEEVINDQDNHNWMTKYLMRNILGRWTTENIQVSLPLLKKNIQFFDRIFLTKNMPEVVQFINDFVGTEGITIKEIVNKGDLIYQPTEEQKKQIFDLNPLDRYLYETAKRRKNGAKSTLEKIAGYFKGLFS
jgi:hypothetical protein